uniref:Uncharacterized protein n=1 Tax=Rhabditophanes sp. KR3021 TaxID=114890 RepID=A0AC35U5P7_9BILA
MNYTFTLLLLFVVTCCNGNILYGGSSINVEAEHNLTHIYKSRSSHFIPDWLQELPLKLMNQSSEVHRTIERSRNETNYQLQYLWFAVASLLILLLVLFIVLVCICLIGFARKFTTFRSRHSNKSKTSSDLEKLNNVTNIMISKRDNKCDENMYNKPKENNVFIKQEKTVETTLKPCLRCNDLGNKMKNACICFNNDTCEAINGKMESNFSQNWEKGPQRFRVQERNESLNGEDLGGSFVQHEYTDNIQTKSMTKGLNFEEIRSKYKFNDQMRNDERYVPYQ